MRSNSFSRLSICSLVNEVRLRCSLRLSRSRAWSSSDGVVVVGVGGAEREFSPSLPSSDSMSSPGTRPPPKKKQTNKQTKQPHPMISPFHQWPPMALDWSRKLGPWLCFFAKCRFQNGGRCWNGGPADQPVVWRPPNGYGGWGWRGRGRAEALRSDYASHWRAGLGRDWRDPRKFLLALPRSRDRPTIPTLETRVPTRNDHRRRRTTSAFPVRYFANGSRPRPTATTNDDRSRG